jgi:hypothetical protein
VVFGALTFLTPRAALVAVAGLVPVLALLAANRRARVVASRLGLVSTPRRVAGSACLAAGACLLVAVAAAQPALRTTERRQVRSRSEISFVVDVSRSMAAAPSVGGRSRLARARSVVSRLHDSVADVPSGLAGLTDRVLPFLFPTVDSATFDETLRRSVAIEAPPPEQVSTNATSFLALTAVTQDGFFGAATSRRTCVLVSDGETRPYPTVTVADALDGTNGCRLIVVRVGGGADRVYGLDGTPEANFVADPAAAANVRALADAAGGRAFDDDQLGAAVAALRADAETGPLRSAASAPSLTALGPFAGAAALILVIGLAGLRLGRQAVAMIRT